MTFLDTSIIVQAPPARVWEVLTDFAAYPDWNPFILSVSGRLEEGARLEVRIKPPEQSPMTFRPRLLAVKPGRELRWLGRVALPGLFDGEHAFEIEGLDGRHSRLRQSERFSGLLPRLMSGKLMGPTRSGFEAMNRALKTRAESAVVPDSPDAEPHFPS
ncbi:MAG TPA: SRPBCC domain-containing protein [Azospirillaceae bacterium]|nr:SRPBCC domain-containing protein [Azospirillaceae bacterium]